MTFDAPDWANWRFNLVVRALVIRDEHLLVTRAVEGHTWLVGGRLKPGETLEQAVLREFREETGVAGRVRRLVYFHENFFGDPRRGYFHELGWYFWVEPQGPLFPLDETRPNPDGENLVLAFAPLADLREAGLLPGFLADRLPADWARRFEGAPYHIRSRHLNGGPELVEGVI